MNGWTIMRRTEHDEGAHSRRVAHVRDVDLAFWAYCVAVGATFAVFLAAVLR